MAEISDITSKNYILDGELLMVIIEAISEMPFRRAAPILDAISNLEEESRIQLAGLKQ